LLTSSAKNTKYSGDSRGILGGLARHLVLHLIYQKIISALTDSEVVSALIEAFSVYLVAHYVSEANS